MSLRDQSLQASESLGPWHKGERSLQQRLGVAEKMESQGRRVIRDFMPDQHRLFYAQLPFLLMGAVDEAGTPWATVLEGPAGFAHSPDPKTLRIAAKPSPVDPLGRSLAKGSPVGILGIELPTRRRNRVNGVITEIDPQGCSVTVEHSFGNCPQYIQTREVCVPLASSAPCDPSIERSATLDDAAKETIATADTFFVASYVDIEGDPARRSVDVSHRGGKQGFVRVDGPVLTIPDFSGNRHFNTLGNLMINPRAGLLFIDFPSGDLLHLTGTTELLLEGEEIARFQGAERLWRLRVEQLVRRRGALSLRFRFGEYSPHSLKTGSWT